MNETSLEIESSEQLKTTPALSEPHFDDTSIATARPVEPLVEPETFRRQSKFVNLFRHLSLSAVLVVAVAIVTMATFVIGLATLRQRSSAVEPVQATKPPGPSVEANTAFGAIAPEQTNTRRAKLRKTRTILANHSKPVARKVGTVYYAR